MDAAEFGREIRKAPSESDRVAWFGALLRRDSQRDIEIVGDSAIEVYLTSATYVSQDIDLVGERLLIERVLRGWGFRQVEGRSHRVYWTDGFVGLVDIVGPSDRSGLPPREVPTPHGPALLSSPEPLIIRRLQRAVREKSTELFDEAVGLARMEHLDWQNLESEARYEKVEPQLERLRRIVRN
jgi:hypothetical protein